MSLRPTRVLAIARRELRQELKGRQGLLVPGVLVALLTPVSLLPKVEIQRQVQFVFGDVPEAIRALPAVTDQPQRSGLAFHDAGDVLILQGPLILEPIRDELDRLRPEGRVELVDYNAEQRVPQRGMLLALLSASSLTGSAASSLGGERSRKTLTTLMTAAVSRLEIVVGKWLAWASLGTVSTVAFAAVAVWRAVDAGPWLLPMAATPGAMAAVALWAVRNSPDVVDATATALRTMPTVTVVAVLLALTLGDVHPLWGAAVPLGGALLSAGSYWEPLPWAADALVGTLSAGVATALFLGWTAWDLDDTTREREQGVGWVAVPGATAAALLALASPLVAPGLWTIAGNPFVTATIPPDAPALAAAIALGAWMGVRAAQHDRPERFFHLGSLRPTAIAWAVGGGLLLAASGPWFGGLADPGTLVGTVALRFDLALVPTGFGPLAALTLLLAEEIAFRGIVGPRMGQAPAAAAWALAKAPLDPVAAIVSGLVMAGVGRAGGFAAGLLTRLIWWAAATSLA